MNELPIPDFFREEWAGCVWQVAYQDRFNDAIAWRLKHTVAPAMQDRRKVCLMPVDCQITFCIPPGTKAGPFTFGGELYVGGRDGQGAVNDNVRLSRFIYRNLANITEISPTMDTHSLTQIFHQVFLVNERGEHPAPMTMPTNEDIRAGRWRVNPGISYVFDDPDAHPYLQQYLEHYTRALAAGGRYALTIWPFHAMLGGIGHALAPIIEEAAFFHAAARQSRVDYRIKGNNPLSENYSVLSPEVLADHCGAPVAEKNSTFIEKLMRFDAILIAGQAKSHCVAWSIDSLLCEINAKDPALAKKVYLLEDCTSPVVVPGIVDFTDQADAAFNRFAEAGMRVVRSTEPMDSWPGFHKSVE